MPKRKRLPQIPDYDGLPRKSENMIVQKANPLQSLSETKMTLSEFKILDAYLSRIDSHIPEARYVRFEKGELEQLLGVTQIKKEDLSKRIDNLFQVITIRDERKPKKFTKFALFSKAECEQDENGQWQVDLACSVEAMEYVFNIENIGYLKYRLKNVINLTSRYSYILYLYLENNRFRKCWNITLEELKKMLCCTAETYNSYKRFNDLILKKCYKELNEKTSIKYSYEPIKKGRKVTGIKFTVATRSDEIEETDPLMKDQLTFDEIESDEEKEIDYGGELANLLGEYACDDEFSPEQIRILQDLILKIIPGTSSKNMERCDYVLEKMHLLNYYNPKKENRFNYLKNILQNEL